MSRKRAWCFTLNNPTEQEIEDLRSAVGSDRCKRAIFGREGQSEGKTPHLQGVVEWTHAVSLSGTKKRLGSNRYHLQPRRGTPWEAWSYCLKEDPEAETWGDAPTEDEDPNDSWGMALAVLENGGSVLDVIRRWPGHVRSINALERALIMIQNGQTQEWRDLEVTYISGSPGCGKTRMVMEGEGYGNVYRVRKGSNPWDGYDGQEAVLFDEFRSDFKLAAMLEWLDGYPVALPARYQDKRAAFTRVYLVSNWELKDQYPGVQDQDPETWAAFLRRIHQVMRMNPDGSLNQVEKP